MADSVSKLIIQLESKQLEIAQLQKTISKRLGELGVGLAPPKKAASSPRLSKEAVYKALGNGSLALPALKAKLSAAKPGVSFESLAGILKAVAVKSGSKYKKNPKWKAPKRGRPRKK